MDEAGLLALLREVLGSRVQLASLDVKKRAEDYLVFTAHLSRCTPGEVLVKVAGPRAPLSCPFERTAAISRLVRQAGVPTFEVVAADESMGRTFWWTGVRMGVGGFLESWTSTAPGSGVASQTWPGWRYGEVCFAERVAARVIALALMCRQPRSGGRTSRFGIFIAVMLGADPFSSYSGAWSTLRQPRSTEPTRPRSAWNWGFRLLPFPTTPVSAQ